MLHIPILRKGRPYRSVDRATAVHHRTREPFVEISQANAGVIRRDLLDQKRLSLPAAELIEITRRAAVHFAEDTLPLGDEGQSPEDYIRQVSATTGLPHPLARRNMARIRGVMESVEDVLRGLTRGLDLRVLDDGVAGALSFHPRTQSLGVILPSNSPGVHALWVPAIAMKVPLVLKPGAAEPWTPYRIAQAFYKAGCPAEAFSYYPADHAGAGEILRHCGRSMMFGDISSVKAWRGDPRIELHGPGYSKIIIGEDCADDWERYLDVIAASIASNSGRSCVNASGVWTPRHGRAIAQALAERLLKIEPRPAEDPQAQLAPFADPSVAQRISSMIDAGLSEPGAEETTARPRCVEFDGCTYLLPTIIRCDSPDHPLANREFLFPFASVVETPQSTMVERIGPTLVVTALTNDETFRRQLLASSNVGRLNFGPIATNSIVWDQPHEGNLFEHLYARRAFQAAAS
jgi:acyl-CoA reductase-like NAD-dependent aldehyde dehydrogenase